MEAHQPRTIVLGMKPILHHAIPDFSSRPVFSNLFEEVVVRVEEEAQARPEIINVKPAAQSPFYVLDSVVQSKS